MIRITVFDDGSQDAHEAMMLLQDYGIPFDTIAHDQWAVQFGEWPGTFWEDTVGGVEREVRRYLGLDTESEF